MYSDHERYVHAGMASVHTTLHCSSAVPGRHMLPAYGPGGARGRLPPLHLLLRGAWGLRNDV